MPSSRSTSVLKAAALLFPVSVFAEIIVVPTEVLTIQEGIDVAVSVDYDRSTVPDECEIDCNSSGIGDACDIETGDSLHTCPTAEFQR